MNAILINAAVMGFIFAVAILAKRYQLDMVWPLLGMLILGFFIGCCWDLLLGVIRRKNESRRTDYGDDIGD